MQIVLSFILQKWVILGLWNFVFSPQLPKEKQSSPPPPFTLYYAIFEGELYFLQEGVVIGFCNFTFFLSENVLNKFTALPSSEACANQFPLDWVLRMHRHGSKDPHLGQRKYY